MTDAALLNQVRPGMRVRTSDGQKLGTVRQVHQRETETYLEVMLDWSPWKLWHVVMAPKHVFLPGTTVTALSGKQVEIALDTKTATSCTWRPSWIPHRERLLFSGPGDSGG